MKIGNRSAIIASLAILCGCLWTFAAFLSPIWRMFTEEVEWADWVSAVIILPVMAIPGPLAAVCGNRLLKVKSKKNIIENIGALSLISVFLLAGVIGGLLPDEYIGILALPIATLLVVPIYVALSKYAVQASIQEAIRYKDLIGKGLLVFVSFQIFLVLNEVVEKHAPLKEGYRHVKEIPWELLALAGPLFAAWVFYKVASRWVEKKRAEFGADVTPPGVASETPRCVDKMKKAWVVLLCGVIIIATAITLPLKLGRWSTVCTAASPDGKVTAVVRCHTMGFLFARYHYYLSFTPDLTFRPVTESVTVKTSGSAYKTDRVVRDWKTRHYIGYLQVLDNPERHPSSVRWEQDGTVCVLSRSGIAGQYEFQKLKAVMP